MYRRCTKTIKGGDTRAKKRAFVSDAVPRCGKLKIELSGGSNALDLNAMLRKPFLALYVIRHGSFQA